MLFALSACSKENNGNIVDGGNEYNTYTQENSKANGSDKSAKGERENQTADAESTQKSGKSIAFKDNVKSRVNSLGYFDSSINRVVGINALVIGVSEIEITEKGRFLAQAILPEGHVVDHWEINGLEVDNDGRKFSLECEAEGPTFVSAVL